MLISRPGHCIAININKGIMMALHRSPVDFLKKKDKNKKANWNHMSNFGRDQYKEHEVP